jgi:hypothetical protein
MEERMTKPPSPAAYRLLDRAFWLIWLGFPVMVWLQIRDLRALGDRLAEAPAEARPFLEALPRVDGFSTGGQVVFWTVFAIEFVVYAALLALAHWAIHRCATGRVFVVEMIAALRAIGFIVAGWPLLELVLANLAMLAYTALGDAPRFLPTFVPDFTVLGVGLLIITIAGAMRQAVALREDADLTI